MGRKWPTGRAESQDERQREGIKGDPRPRDVDGADHLAAIRVADGAGRTGPSVERANQVFGRVDLHCALSCQGGAHRVRAGRVLGPADALGQSEGITHAQHVALALPPQDKSLGVGHDQQMLRLLGDRDERSAHQRDHSRERVPLADLVDFGLLEDQFWIGPLGINVRGQRPPPGVGDDLP